MQPADQGWMATSTRACEGEMPKFPQTEDRFKQCFTQRLDKTNRSSQQNETSQR